MSWVGDLFEEALFVLLRIFQQDDVIAKNIIYKTVIEK